MSTWREAVQVAAPMIATALGGPLAGLAASVVGRVLLGSEGQEASLEQVQQAALEATQTPEGMARLREAETALRQAEMDYQVRFAELGNEDRANAREREVKKGDGTTSWIAKAVIAYYGLSNVAMLVGVYLVISGDIGVTADNREMIFLAATIVNNIFTNAISALMLVLSYYFGSSQQRATPPAQPLSMGR